MKTVTKLSITQQKKIIRLYNEGFGCSTVAELVSLGRGTVEGFLRRNKLFDTNRRGYTFKMRAFNKSKRKIEALKKENTK